MKCNRNYDGYEEQEGFELIPAGEELMFEISEISDGYSSNNDPMPNICLSCIDDGNHEGKKIWDNILIPEPDSPAHKIIGRTKRFLHAIDEPYQGDFDVDTDNWINKTVLVKVGQEKVTQGKWAGKMKNTVDRYLLSESQQNTSSKLNNKSKIKKHEEEARMPWDTEDNNSKNNDGDGDIPF